MNYCKSGCTLVGVIEDLRETRLGSLIRKSAIGSPVGRTTPQVVGSELSTPLMAEIHNLLAAVYYYSTIACVLGTETPGVSR